MAISGKDKVCQDICNVFGLKNVRSLNIDMAVDRLVIVGAEFFPEIEGVMQLVPIFKRYRLIEIEEENENKEVL